MATASVPVEPEDMDCSVCHELLSDPKLLPCGHCLCRHCLLSWLHSQRPALCPLCRCAIVVDAEEGDRTSMEDIADGLPTDLAIAALVEARRLLERDHKCCVCDDVAATSLCLHCGDMLCAACTIGHGKLSATRQHKVESLASVTADTVAANRPVPCAVHADKATELFCSTHGQTICHVCATSRHRGCSEVRDLEEMVGETRALLAQLADTLRAGERELDRSIQQLDDHLKEVEKQSAAAIAHIDAMCLRLAQSVEACRRRLTEMTHGACGDVREAVSEAKTCLLQRRGKLTTHTRVVERVQDAKSRHTVTSMTPKLKTRVDDLDYSVTLPADAKAISKVTLIIDPEVVSRLEKELSELGQVKVTPTDIIAHVKTGLGGGVGGLPGQGGVASQFVYGSPYGGGRGGCGQGGYGQGGYGQGRYGQPCQQYRGNGQYGSGQYGGYPRQYGGGQFGSGQFGGPYRGGPRFGLRFDEIPASAAPAADETNAV